MFAEISVGESDVCDTQRQIDEILYEILCPSTYLMNSFDSSCKL